MKAVISIFIVAALIAISMCSAAMAQTYIIEGSNGSIALPSTLVGKLVTIKVVAVPPAQPDLGDLVPIFSLPLRGGARVNDYGITLSLVGGNLTGIATINVTSSNLTISAWATYDCIGPGVSFLVAQSVPVDKVIVEVNPNLTFIQSTVEIGSLLPDVLGHRYAVIAPTAATTITSLTVVDVVTGATHEVYVPAGVTGVATMYARLGSHDWLLFDTGVVINNSYVPLAWSAVLPFDKGILLALTSYNGTATYKLMLCSPAHPLGESVMDLPSQAYALCSIDGHLLAVGLQNSTIIVDTGKWIAVAEVPNYCICAATKIRSGKIFAVALKDVAGTPYICFIEVDPTTWNATELEVNASLVSWNYIGITGLTIRRHNKALLWLYDIKDYESSMLVLVDTVTGNYSILIQYGDIGIGTADVRWEAVPRVAGDTVFLPTSWYGSGYYAVTIDLSSGTVNATNNTIALTAGGTWIQYVGGHTVCFRNVYVVSGLIQYFNHSEIWLAEPSAPRGAHAFSEPGCSLVAVTTDKGPLSPEYVSLANYITGAIIEAPNGTVMYVELPSPIEVSGDGDYQVLAVPFDSDIYLLMSNATYACVKNYSRNELVVEVEAPSGSVSRLVAWLPAAPKTVLADGVELKYDPNLSGPNTWRYDPDLGVVECLVEHHSPVVLTIIFGEEQTAAATTTTTAPQQPTEESSWIPVILLVALFLLIVLGVLLGTKRAAQVAAQSMRRFVKKKHH